MRRSIVCFLAVLFATSSCNQSKEDSKCEDPVFKYHYTNCLNVILLRQTGHPVEFYEVAHAYEMLERITGLKSRVGSGSDSPYFYTDSNYHSLQQDVAGWIKWYNHNKCNYSMADVSHLLQEEGDEKSDYNKPGVMESLRILYGNLDSLELIRLDSLNHEKLKLQFPSAFAGLPERFLGYE